MGQSARVTSIEVLVDFKAALCLFARDAEEALCSVDVEVRRTFDWLQDQLKYWQREIRDREDDVVQAKAVLRRKQVPNALGRIPDCTEEEKALERAEYLLDEAQEKLRNVRRWLPMLQREMAEYEGPAGRLKGTLNGELPRTIAWLGQKIVSLEAYVEMAPPSSGGPEEVTSLASGEAAASPGGPGRRQPVDYRLLRQKTPRPSVRDMVAVPVRGTASVPPGVAVAIPMLEVMHMPGASPLSSGVPGARR